MPIFFLEAANFFLEAANTQPDVDETSGVCLFFAACAIQTLAISFLTPSPTRTPVMAVPKRKHSNSRTGKRRSHDALKKRSIGYCPQCSSAVPTHHICPKCGYYQGRTVVQHEES